MYQPKKHISGESFFQWILLADSCFLRQEKADGWRSFVEKAKVQVLWCLGAQQCLLIGKFDEPKMVKMFKRTNMTETTRQKSCLF